MVPKDLRGLFDRLPLAYGETRKLYCAMLSGMIAALKPRDTLEWLWLKDIADIEWEIVRLRYFPSALLSYQQELELARYLSQDRKLCVGGITTVKRGPPIGERLDLARRCLEGDGQAKRDVNAVLGKKKRTFHHQSLATKAFLNVIDALDNTNRMLALAEARRDRLIRIVENYRQSILTTIQVSKPVLTYRPILKPKRTALQDTSSKKIATKEHRAT